MSLFEKFELAREVSEICDPVVPLIKVVIVEGGKRGDSTGDVSDLHVVAAMRAAAAGHRRNYSNAANSCRDDDEDEDDEFWYRRKSLLTQQRETCKNPFCAIMEDDVDRTCGKNGCKRRTPASTAGKYIELEVYSRSVNYFHEQVDNDHQPPHRSVNTVAKRSSL